MKIFVPALLVLAFSLWLVVVTISGFGDMIDWWEYAEVCEPRDVLAFCWTGDKEALG